jgi:hypothetical protein
MDRQRALGHLAWVEPPACACGCGGVLALQRQHRWVGVPRYIHGHHARVRPPNASPELEAWVVEHQGKHHCACGCGTPISIRKRHRREGIPNYLHQHVPRPSPGSGPDHPAYRKDRTLLKGRGRFNFTGAIKRSIFLRDQGRCVRCGHDRKLQCDHVVPVFMGGGPDGANGQLLCLVCHGLKSLYELATREREADVDRLVRCIRAFWAHTMEGASPCP